MRKNNSSCFNIFYIIIELSIEIFMLPIKILKAISDVLSDLPFNLFGENIAVHIPRLTPSNCFASSGFLYTFPTTSKYCIPDKPAA